VVNGHLGLCGDGPGENGVADHDCWREDVDWSNPRRCLYHCLIARNNEKGEYDREDTTRNDLAFWKAGDDCQWQTETQKIWPVGLYVVEAAV